MINIKHTRTAVVALCVIAGVVSNPVRRSDLEAQRRSAVDRSMIRFGRSYPPEPSSEIQDQFQRPTRRGNSFLRFGRSQPVTFTTDDLITLLRTYEHGDDDEPSKRSPNFVRLGRDPKFIRLGRTVDEEKPNYEQSSDLYVNGYPQRKNRARDHFIRLGRDREVINEEEKRSVESCRDCES